MSEFKLPSVRVVVRLLSAVFGVAAAGLWFWSACGPFNPDAVLVDPVAARHIAHLNQYAAATTGVSVLLMAIAEFL